MKIDKFIVRTVRDEPYVASKYKVFKNLAGAKHHFHSEKNKDNIKRAELYKSVGQMDSQSAEEPFHEMLDEYKR